MLETSEVLMVLEPLAMKIETSPASFVVEKQWEACEAVTARKSKLPTCGEGFEDFS